MSNWYNFKTLPVQELRDLSAEALLKRLNELKELRTKLDVEIEMTDLMLHALFLSKYQESDRE